MGRSDLHEMDQQLSFKNILTGLPSKYTEFVAYHQHIRKKEKENKPFHKLNPSILQELVFSAAFQDHSSFL